MPTNYYAYLRSLDLPKLQRNLDPPHPQVMVDLKTAQHTVVAHGFRGEGALGDKPARQQWPRASKDPNRLNLRNNRTHTVN